MKIVTFTYSDKSLASAPQLGVMDGDQIVPVRALPGTHPESMLALMEAGPEAIKRLDEAWKSWAEQHVAGSASSESLSVVAAADAKYSAPIPNPPSCRDAYAFRQHVETSRRNRGLPMIPEFDEIPVFYFTNHRAIFGPGDVPCMPLHFDKLDFELEVAIVLNRGGRNIAAKDADQYIGGFMIMNDLSARSLQMQEMKLNLGPAKGKDFATVLGPYLVTPDELSSRLVKPLPGHVGNSYDLEMCCRVNGVEVSRGNFSSMNWTFAEIIERASYGVDLYAGDVIGSGTVGTGCFLELNGTGKLENPDGYQEQWLQAGDVVEMEVTGLGVLRNRIVAAE